MAGVRLDVHIHSRLPELSRASIQKLIEQGAVKVNGTIQTKTGYRLRPADKLEVAYDATTQIPPSIQLPVIYEDEDCVVINKPAGVLTHSKGSFNVEATVATWLSGRLKPGLTGNRAGIVHRLDRATSGLMICAKTPAAQQWLQKQFSQRKVKKTYLALVKGRLEPEQAIIDMPIERNPRHPQTFRVGHRGKPATTAYKILRANGEISLVELQPTTGRTHQLRVHLAQLGHPILGDRLYGGPPADRLALHAQALELTLPNKQRRLFQVSLPPDFNRLEP